MKPERIADEQTQAETAAPSGDPANLQALFEFGPAERAALAWHAKDRYSECSDYTMRVTAFMVLLVALAHPREVAAWIESLARYRDAEAFPKSLASDLAIARARIAARPEYVSPVDFDI